MITGRQIFSLNGDEWRLSQVSEQHSETFPATVPGDARLDLLRAGRLPDPHWGQNSLQGQWVDEHDWWLARDLDGFDFPPDRRVFLRLRGVDYVSNIYFNGRHLARHEGMFSPQLYEVTKLWTVGPGKKQIMPGALAVRLSGAAHLPFERADRLTRWRDKREQGLGMPNRWPHRRSVLKCQMGFGWDFAPDLPSLGLWDDVDLIVTGDVFIRDLIARPMFRDGPQVAVRPGSRQAVRLRVTLDLDALAHAEVQVGLNLYGLNCDAPPLLELFPVSLQPGRQQLEFNLEVPEPHLWWPWDRGAPNLYTLLATVRRRSDLLDRVSQNFGLRQVQLEPNPQAPAEPGLLPWVFVINGQRTFLRGANWVPANIFPGQVTDDDYKELLDLARQANMNALRVWGGGLREKAAFYDCCDQMGILLWQEFPVACAFFTRYPQSDEYLAVVDQETRAIVRTLRHHPSVILWSGGNEFDPARNEPLVRTMSAAVAAEDQTRTFVPASPAGGDRHNWHVWHGLAPVSAYREEESQFASEFGLQAPPVLETLRQFIPEEELWPPGPSWEHHNADWKKLWRYAAPFLGDAKPDQVTLDEFVQASQRAQAYGLQVAIEHHRRRKYACGGSLLWQFNTPWPAIEWAILDYYRRPKLAYQVVQRLYAPTIISLEYPLTAYEMGSKFSPEVWVINDRAEALRGCSMEITLETSGGILLERMDKTLDLPADRAEVVTRFSWTLPANARWVRCRLRQGEEELAFNEYDLSIHDARQPGRWQSLRARVGDRLMGGN